MCPRNRSIKGLGDYKLRQRCRKGESDLCDRDKVKGKRTRERGNDRSLRS